MKAPHLFCLFLGIFLSAGTQADVYRPHSSCGKYDVKILAAASKLVTEKLVPCLSGHNFSLGKRLSEYLEKSDEFLGIEVLCRQSCGPFMPKCSAFTDPVEGSSIHLADATPSIEKKYFPAASDQQVASRVAKSLFHESLHHLGLDHEQDSCGLFKDATYGCPLVCEETLDLHPLQKLHRFDTPARVNYRAACESCAQSSGWFGTPAACRKYEPSVVEGKSCR